MDKVEANGIHGIVISSVVPPLDSTLRQVCERYFKTKPLFIGPGIKTGMPVLYENPAEVGSKPHHCELRGCIREIWRAMYFGGLRNSYHF